MTLALAGFAEMGLESSLWVGYIWLCLPAAALAAAVYFRSITFSYIAVILVLGVAVDIEPLDPWVNPMSAQGEWYDPDELHWDRMYRIRSACWFILLCLSATPMVIKLKHILTTRRIAQQGRSSVRR